ncbi:MAG TPA: response regulator transcription factor [Bacteroidales bacterium]|nr:response regulator transcription factor [Bacteroidales bacterium]HPS62870.1 response regulator transcription factor [Bacteroidales bacterium]
MNILVADDHPIVREGIRQILSTLPEVTSIDEAWKGDQAMQKIKTEKYDLIILDITMPGLSGIDILQQIRDRNIKTNVLVLSFHPEEQYAIHALKMGAAGYLTKDTASDELIMAMKKIANGGKYISSSIAEKLLADDPSETNRLPHDQLSQREFQIMLMLARGMSVTQIAATLFLSDKTVSTYRGRILAKMKLEKNADLSLYAIRHSLIS